ncbi:MAG: bifunctional metallophosphatase/5'-nucleotidase [Oscillospiraceae bacterium]|nr:bifunctional metallophosphatase/5'-nucleotidase [Oscillospiraceae bacterium]
MKKLTSFFTAVTVLIGLNLSMPITAGADDSADFQIRIVHTNDIHARVIENEKSSIIGVERLGDIIDKYTDGADIGLVLDSGDTFHGQSVATLVQGSSIAELMQSCGYDAMTAGNHDWSYGKDRLKELADIAETKMLTGNVVDENGKPFFRDEFYTEEITKDDKTLKVGVFGVIDPKIYSSTAPSNVEGLTFTDPVEFANKAAKALKDKGCDVVIALSHTYDPAGLAAQVDGVDLWLCGHEHIGLDTTVTTPDGSTAYVVENGYYLYQVGLIELNCALDENGELISLSFNRNALGYKEAAEYEKKAEVTALLDKINSEQSVILNKTVGSSPAELDGVWEHLRIDETNLGRAVTAAYLKATGADVAFENAGGIRASVKKGEVTYGDIIGVSPYGNYIVTKKVTGKQLKEILETSLDIQMQCIEAYERGDNDAWPQSSGSYLQTGGMTVVYDPAQEYGSRVISVEVGESPLDEDRLYTVATNNYAATSKYYPQLAEAEEVGEFCACDEALIEFFKQDSSVIEAAVNRQGMTAAPQDDSTPADDSAENEDYSPKTGIVIDMTAAWAAFAAAAVMAGMTIGKRARRK